MTFAFRGFKFSELEMSTSSPAFRELQELIMNNMAESVLTTLLPAFKFELPDSPEPIMWNISGVVFPSMGNGSSPSMLLKVTSLGNSAAM